MMSNYEPIAYGLIISLCCMLVKHRLALSRENHTRQLKKQDTFRSVFSNVVEILRELDVNETGQVFEFPRSKYLRCEQAVIEYSGSLGFFDKWLLKRRWANYRGNRYANSDEDRIYCLGHYIGDDPKDERIKRYEAIKAITQLMVL